MSGNHNKYCSANQLTEKDKRAIKTYCGGKQNYLKPREWVDLTDEEIAVISVECCLVTPSDLYFARAIEAKLKEKNN